MSHIRRYKGNPYADCNTIVLPQNLTYLSGANFEDFEAQADWTATAGSRADNAVEFKTGAQSIKQTSPVGAIGSMNKTINWDLSGAGRMSLWIYLHDAVTNYGTIYITFYNEPAMTNGYNYSITPILKDTTGWTLLNIPKSSFTQIAAGSWASPMVKIKLRVTGTTGNIANISWDSMRLWTKSFPAIMFRFDDGYANQYTNAFAYMKPHRIPGTMYVKTSLVNVGPISWAQLADMYANGWAICNHTRDHVPMAGQSQADQETQISNGKADLTANGLTAYINHFAYPGGGTMFDANSFLALAAQGAITAACGNYTYPASSGVAEYLPGRYIYRIGCQNIDDTVSLATAEGYIDQTIIDGNILIPLFHSVGAAGQMTAADFHALIDFVVARKYQIVGITIEDYKNLTLGPVRVVKAK